MASDNKELLQATETLTNEVHKLADRLSAKEVLHRRTRMLTIIAVIIGVLSAIGVGFAGYAVHQNDQNAKTGCVNANQVREAQRNIWNFLFAATDPNDPEVTEEDKILLDRLETYINKVFAERDCDNLGKKYNLPPAPIPTVEDTK